MLVLFTALFYQNIMDGLVCGYLRIHNGPNMKSFDNFESGARKMEERRFSWCPVYQLWLSEGVSPPRVVEGVNPVVSPC